MSNGMNLEQAIEYAKTMTYIEAVRNVGYAKGIHYKKATIVKLRELAEIAVILEELDGVVVPREDVERKRDEWIDNHNGTFTCSGCGNKHSKANFCPNCGTDMRKPPTEEIGDCNICRFVGCSECDDCVNGSQWVRAVKGVDYEYEQI